MKKYENFCSSLGNMKDIYNYEEPYDNVVLTGLVGLYEIYNQKIALGIVNEAKTEFYKMFVELKEEIENGWL